MPPGTMARELRGRTLVVCAVLLQCVVSIRADDVDPPRGQSGGDHQLVVASPPQKRQQSALGVDHPLGVLQVTPIPSFHYT
jgi:hypothetical protein